MKIIQTNEVWSEGRRCLTIQIQTKIADLGDTLHFHDGEPEDNSLLRNFKDCYQIVRALQLAYGAGQRGEPLELEEIHDESS